MCFKGCQSNIRILLAGTVEFQVIPRVIFRFAVLFVIHNQSSGMFVSEDCFLSFPAMSSQNGLALTNFSAVAGVFELHMEELRAKQEEISKRDKEIKLLEAIIQTLGGKSSHSSDE